MALNQTMANDTIFLVNYDKGGSAMRIYNNIAWYVNGERPNQVTLLVPQNTFTWEGNVLTVNLWLPFITTVNASALQQPAGTQVGTAQQIRNSVLSPNLASVPNVRG